MRLFANELAERTEISRLIAESFEPGQELSVLEAGCGREWRIELPGEHNRLTGVDLNPDALRYRKETVGDLDEAILGDLAVVDLPPESFDLTYSAFVLEHVPDASAVLERLDACTAPGGLIVLRLPDRDSVFGVVARHTPFRAHVWFYRYVLRDRHAGTEGRAPFETHYSNAMGRGALREYFGRSGYDILEEGIIRPFPAKSGVFWRLIRASLLLAERATHGRVAGDHINYFIVARKHKG